MTETWIWVPSRASHWALDKKREPSASLSVSCASSVWRLGLWTSLFSRELPTPLPFPCTQYRKVLKYPVMGRRYDTQAAPLLLPPSFPFFLPPSSLSPFLIPWCNFLLLLGPSFYPGEGEARPSGRTFREEKKVFIMFGPSPRDWDREWESVPDSWSKAQVEWDVSSFPPGQWDRAT